MAQPTFSQLAKKGKEAKGPRALGLVELSSDGNARLIPIAIMVDGKFYDAGAYKASPVPLALWSETVYEAEKTGVPQGLFTVGGAMRTGSAIWFGEGKWRPAGSEPKKRLTAAKPKMDDDEGPPKLRRSGLDKREESTKPTSPEPTSPPPTAPSDDKKSSSKGDATKPADSPAPTNPSAGDKTPEASAAGDANDDDPNRPILRRGKTQTEGSSHPEAGASTGVARRPAASVSKIESNKTDSKKTTQSIPAISDAGGPDPRPYTYDIRPDEEQKYRKGMLALASEAVLARVKETTPSAPAARPASRTAPRRTTKTPQPVFDDVRFQAFDLWNTNEPVFVLSAAAHMPTAPGVSGDSMSHPYFVTMVAKKNIYDELRKLYAGVTDSQHLDETPRLELVDAVDADGDGRGELLFRRISDAGSAWGIYRAGADQLFPLFEGTPAGR